VGVVLVDVQSIAALSCGYGQPIDDLEPLDPERAVEMYLTDRRVELDEKGNIVRVLDERPPVETGDDEMGSIAEAHVYHRTTALHDSHVVP
jgi:hypothetical protein